MFNLTKKSAVEVVLNKRFGVTDPSEVEDINEVNIWVSADNEIGEFGISVEIKFEEKETENYQVNKKGIIFSWGNTPVIDERSQTTDLNLETVYQSYSKND